MLPNKVLGKYDWNVDGKTGIGAAWVVAAFILPILVWAVFMLSRMQGWLAPTKANPIWALVWLLICLPDRLRHIERTRFAAHRLYPPGPAQIVADNGKFRA